MSKELIEKLRRGPIEVIKAIDPNRKLYPHQEKLLRKIFSGQVKRVFIPSRPIPSYLGKTWPTARMCHCVNNIISQFDINRLRAEGRGE